MLPMQQSIQNYFRMYEKLAGMTGTAVTEGEEFHQIYKTGSNPIPTNLEYQAFGKNRLIPSIGERTNQVIVTLFMRIVMTLKNHRFFINEKIIRM